VDPTSWGTDDHEKGEGSAQKELVNDLKAVSNSKCEQTIGNTLCRNGLKSCSARKAQLKKAHVEAHLRFANEHLMRYGEKLSSLSSLEI